jgi:hypothetical protein
VCVGAVQSNVVDKALRDYEATVSENMLMTNSIGALLVFVVVLVKEPDAFAFFFGDWFYLSLITFRSIVFWLGAVFYTTLVKHFRRGTSGGDYHVQESFDRYILVRVLFQR